MDLYSFFCKVNPIVGEGKRVPVGLTTAPPHRTIAATRRSAVAFAVGGGWDGFVFGKYAGEGADIVKAGGIGNGLELFIGFAKKAACVFDPALENELMR